jgi:hypothetical protein
MPTQKFGTRKIGLSLWIAGLAFLVFASTAAAVSYTVTLTNGTTFVTRHKPQTADFDETIALIRTDQSNLIAVKKSEITDITASTEASGFAYQVDASTIFLGWSPYEAAPEGDAAAQGDQGGQAGQAGGKPAAAAPESGSRSGYSVEQFVDIPASGTLPSGFSAPGAEGGRGSSNDG